jgi:hypothetical protein
LQEAKPLLQALSDAADVGVKMAEARHAGRTLSPDAIAHFSSIVKRAGEPHAAVELPAAAVIQRLISHTP